MSSLRADISALSSIGLPSFRLNFFRSALRRFFDDLLQIMEIIYHTGDTPEQVCVGVCVSYEEMRELLWEYLEPVITLLASE